MAPSWTPLGEISWLDLRVTLRGWNGKGRKGMEGKEEVGEKRWRWE